MKKFGLVNEIFLSLLILMNSCNLIVIKNKLVRNKRVNEGQPTIVLKAVNPRE